MSCQDLPRQFEERQRAQRIELLEEDNKELRERERNLKRVSEEFARMLDSLQAETESLRGKLRDAEKQLKEYNGFLEAANGENKELRRRIQQMLGMQATMNRDSDAGSLKAEFERSKMKEEIDRLKRELTVLKEKESLYESIKEREHAIKMKEMEFSLNAASTERRFKEEQAFHEETRRKYEQQLRRLELRTEELQEKRIEKENELASIFTKLKEAEIENSYLRKKLEVDECNIQQERDKVRQRSQAEIEALRKDNESMKQELKFKEMESRVASHESRKILLSEKTKNTMLREAASKLKTTYEQKNSLIIRQLLSKEEKIDSLKRELSKSQSKAGSRVLTESSLRDSVASPRMLKMTCEPDSSADGSTVHSLRISECEQEKVSRELFKSRENRQIQFTVEKNEKSRFQKRR